jgi:hypothetical protein
VANVLAISLVMVALVAAAGLSYLLSQRAFRRDLSELEERTALQLAKVAETVKSLEGEVARLRTSASTQSAVAPTPSQVPAQPAAEKPAKKAPQVTPEIVVMMTAAITAFLGKKVRIRSARILEPSYEIVNSWAHLGRVIVQASHNLSLRS